MAFFTGNLFWQSVVLTDKKVKFTGVPNISRNMDYLDLVRWFAVAIIVILYTIFFFELFDQYFYNSIKSTILSPPNNETIPPSKEL